MKYVVLGRYTEQGLAGFIKNPNDKEETIDLAPHELIDNIIADEEKTMKLLKEVKELIKKEIPK